MSIRNKFVTCGKHEARHIQRVNALVEEELLQLYYITREEACCEIRWFMLQSGFA